MKNRQLNQWLWKWHFIAGIISIPFVLVLSITGAIYLFKDEVEKPVISALQTIEPNLTTPTALSLQEQLVIAKQTMKKPISAYELPMAEQTASTFVSGRFGKKQTLFINPYTGEAKGKFHAKDTWMYTVRKLHGELLGGKVGTKFIELVACWMVVLVLTGLYIWFPFKKGKWAGVFRIRTKQGKQVLYRDIHAVSGFWISIILLLTLAGGLPWTDVFGGYFKNIQKLTNTGYPAAWRGRGVSSTPNGAETLSLDKMVAIAKAQNLKGKVSVSLPRGPKGTFSVSNQTFDFGAQRMLHFDQYSGDLVKKLTWEDVGILMKGRMWAMAFHQGQLGGWNFWLMLIFSLVLFLMSLSALLSYFLRKPQQGLGIPKVPAQFTVGKGVVTLIILLGLIFPLFGLSVILIYIGHLIQQKIKPT